MRSRAAAFAILLLLGPLLPVPSPWPDLAPGAEAQATLPGVTYAWWDDRWHMRVPVLLEPRIVDRLNGGLVDLAGAKVRNYPAIVEVDFTRAIREADDGGFGWPKDNQGNLASFTFDTGSVRVVEHDRFKGCPLVRDRLTSQLRCIGGGDRGDEALLPSTFSQGLWENPGGADPLFHPERNAVGTVQFVVRGEFTAPRLFFVYFDVLQNGAKEPAAYRPQDTGILDGLHFVRWGTDVTGFAPGTQVSGPGVIMAQALFDNTTIAIFKYVSRSVEPAEMVRTTVHALSNNQNTQAGTCPSATFPGTVCLEVPQGDRFFFRVLANKPVVVGMRTLRNDLGPGWVPSKDGGLSGTQFLFRALGETSQTGVTVPVYAISMTGAAQVTVQDLDAGSFNSLTVDGAQGFRTEPGNRYVVSSNRPIMLLGSSTNNAFGAQLLNHYGGPEGAHLVGFVHNDLTVVGRDERPAEILLGCKLGCSEPNIKDEPLEPGVPSYFGGGGYGAVGEVWRIDTKDERPLWAKAGEAGIVPLGGRHGMNFTVSLQAEHTPGTTIVTSLNDRAETRLLLIGAYNNTRVLVKPLNGTGKPAFNGTLSVHEWLDRGADGRPVIPYGDYRVEASKPVLAYLYGPGSANRDPPFSAYFSAKVEPPLQAIGKGEFHGFAVGWEDKVKTAAVGPDETVRLKLRVINLGRGVGASSITDDIQLSREVTNPANASLARLEPSNVSLSSVLEAGVPSFQGRDITLSAHVPATATAGTVYQVAVTATSKGNPAFHDTLRVVITVQIRYEFALRFVETNSTSIQKIIKSDAETCIDIEARNTGTGDVRVRLQMAPTAKSDAALGFTPLLLPFVAGACSAAGEPLLDDDGEGLAPLVLAVGQARSLTLYVKAPSGTNPLPLELDVQGTALEDASVRQQLSATVFTNVEAKVKLTALNETRRVLPGGNASFDILIENVGDVETPVEYGTTGLLPLGWGIAFGDAPPILRGRGSLDALGRPLDKAVFTVNITAARTAPVAMVVPVNVVATSAIIIDTGDTARAFKQSDTAKVTAVVGNNFTLEQPDTLPITINPGDPFTLAFDLRNAANGNFTLRVQQGALPRNWTMDVLQPRNATTLEQGDRVGVRVNVTPEVATKAGAYDVGLAFVTQDAFTQGAQFRNATILVRSTVEFRIVPEADDLILAPGSQRELGLRVVNTGNLPVALRLGALAPSGYQAMLPQGTKVELQPGEERALSLLLRAPDQAAEAPAQVRITGLDDTSNKQKEFPITVRTARLDLVVTEPVLVTPTLEVGRPAVLAVKVQNTGTVAANNVALALIVNGKGVRNETLRSLPPGEPRTVTLPWTVDETPRDVVVVIDPDGKYAEADETNNQAALALGARGVPGFEAGLALLAAAVGLAGRARLKPPTRGAGRDG